VGIDPGGALRRAREVAARAHAPYSGVHVGAVLVDADGREHTGVNVESASYGVTICAERAALARAVADGAGPLRRLAVARGDGRPISPCGACRQALAELGGELVVIYLTPDGPRERPLAELLPDPFLDPR
jgi:cytidine deaminase